MHAVYSFDKQALSGNIIKIPDDGLNIKTALDIFDSLKLKPFAELMKKENVLLIREILPLINSTFDENGTYADFRDKAMELILTFSSTDSLGVF